MILRKITIIVAARYHILRLKCTKFYFGWAPPNPAGGAYIPLAGFKRTYSKGREPSKGGTMGVKGKRRGKRREVAYF